MADDEDDDDEDGDPGQTNVPLLKLLRHSEASPEFVGLGAIVWS